jgi:AcrR family transcriptional regulator
MHEQAGRLSNTSSASLKRGLRADARRNRERLLLAARDVFVELGPEAPLDEVARRAGVGIATLYRRFPDRRALQRAVALDVLRRAADALLVAEAEAPDPFGALAAYMHAALDLRISAVLPALLGHISFDDDELRQARQVTSSRQQRLIDAAQKAGGLRPDVTFGDVGLLLVRLSQPLPGEFPRELDARLAHRHLELVLAGLAMPARMELPGPGLSLEQLRNLR